MNWDHLHRKKALNLAAYKLKGKTIRMFQCDLWEMLVNVYSLFSCKSPLKSQESASPQSFMSLSIFCRHKSISIQRESARGGEDKEKQPGEREVDRSPVQRNAARPAQPAQHNDRRLCLQIFRYIRASMFVDSQALVTNTRARAKDFYKEKNPL